MHRVDTNGWNRLDHSRRWIAAGDGSHPEMDRGRRWIAAGDGSRQDMDRDRMWMKDRRWISGDGSRETDDNQSLSYMRILRLCEIIRFSRSRL
jgi:hypothetical protein